MNIILFALSGKLQSKKLLSYVQCVTSPLVVYKVINHQRILPHCSMEVGNHKNHSWYLNGSTPMWLTALLHQSHALPSYFTLLSFSVWLAWLMLMSSTGLPLRGMGEKWDVSRGCGLMLYRTLGVHFTEKNLDLGGALLRTETSGDILESKLDFVYTTQTCCIKERMRANICVCVLVRTSGGTHSEGTSSDFNMVQQVVCQSSSWSHDKSYSIDTEDDKVR